MKLLVTPSCIAALVIASQTLAGVQAAKLTHTNLRHLVDTDSLQPTIAPTSSPTTTGSGATELSVVQQSIIDLVIEAFGTENCQEVKHPGTPIAGFQCVDTSTLTWAYVQTQGADLLAIDILDFATGKPLFEDICSTDPAIGTSFEECTLHLQDFLMDHLTTTPTPVLSEEQTELKDMVMTFFGAEECSTETFGPNAQVTFCGKEERGGLVQTTGSEFAVVVVNFSGIPIMTGELEDLPEDGSEFLQLACGSTEGTVEFARSSGIVGLEPSTFKECGAILSAFFQQAAEPGEIGSEP